MIQANPPAGSRAEREMLARRPRWVPPWFRRQLRPWRFRLSPRRRWSLSPMRPITWAGRWSVSGFLVMTWVAWVCLVATVLLFWWVALVLGRMVTLWRVER